MLTDGADCNHQQQNYPGLPHLKSSELPHNISISLLTGGSDRPYAFGLAASLGSQGVSLDMIGSDELDLPQFRSLPRVNFLNLRGSSQTDVTFTEKVLRILAYYARLIGYAATAKPKIFHILWNSRFETFDRTILMLYYRCLGKKVVLTVHNVNADKRDRTDNSFNRFTLRIQYKLADRLFVHTEKMKRDLIEEFGLRGERVTVIPFGINNAVPNTSLAPDEAKRRLGLGTDERAVLFFGRITPYKGLDWVIPAFRTLVARNKDYRLIIAGWPDRCEAYWGKLRGDIQEDIRSGTILLKDEFIPDEDVEMYFKAADALILPYRDIYQSGVLFLGQSFGLPVLAADVGSLKDEIVVEKMGYVFRPEDPVDLVKSVERYFASDLYRDLDRRRAEIYDYAVKRHSWDVVGQTTLSVYAGLL
jgi:glycosyltransferase involved in cell wall biosynthesis